MQMWKPENKHICFDKYMVILGYLTLVEMV